LPESWTEEQRTQFNEACSAMDLTLEERDAALASIGDFAAAMVEVDNAAARRS